MAPLSGLGPRYALLTVVAAVVLAASGCGGSTQPAGTITPASVFERSAEAHQKTTTSGQATTQTAPATSTPASAAVPEPSPSAVVPEPPIVQDPIPFGPKRKAEMVAYAMRHYGLDTYRLIDPHVIVIHYTETPTFQSTYDIFAVDQPDSELHELPQTCAHFVIDRHGVIHQLVPLTIMCRHTVGLNWTAIGIEHVGFSDAQILDNHPQITASLELVRWLRCRYNIPIRDVIGHNESLSSPYHHENVAALRTQTHSDFNHADMQIYRARLAALGPC